jgi:hypothetical protein
MAEPSIVSVAFRDLADTYGELSSGDSSPKGVRRGFANFVDLSQKLTSHMRTEYSEKTGKKWVPSSFDDWNDITELFKQLRNDDQHDRPISILVNETQYFRVFEDDPTLTALSGTWSFSLDDQLADSPRNDLVIGYVDLNTGRPSGELISPVRKEYEFHLHPSSNKVKALLEEIGDTNVRTLSDKCFETLTAYYDYYRRNLMQPESPESQER